MKPLQKTSWFAIAVSVVIGFGIGYLVQTGLSSAGSPPLIPPYSLPATLLTVTAIVLGFAIALRRSITGANKRPVNPFVAMRVVAAAKASIIAGAVFLGFAMGILIYFGMRTVAPGADAWWPVITTALAAVIQVVVGLIAEHLGKVPPTASDDEPGQQNPGEGDELPTALPANRQAERS